MNETVYVEFLFDQINPFDTAAFIVTLGADFDLITSDLDFEIDDGYGNFTPYWRITGKISAEKATMLKLGDLYVRDRMRVSYISDELKNKYRS